MWRSGQCGQRARGDLLDAAQAVDACIAGRAGVAENNDVVVRVAKAQGTLFIDFARLAPQDDEAWAGDDPVHMSAEGYRQQAEIFARFLVDNGLVGTAP